LQDLFIYMDKGIYTALSGTIAKSHEIELIANNLANASTPGFKRDTGTFHEYLPEIRKADQVGSLQSDIQAHVMQNGRTVGDKSFVEMDGVYTSFRQGTIRRTSRPLDVALNGKGFFEILTPSGIRYTRQGNLNRSSDGFLVTSNGFHVLSSGDGPPAQRLINIGNRSIQIDGQGNIYQNGAQVSSLGIQEFEATQWLEKVGNSYFQNKHDKNLKATVTETNVRQGFIEGSNVNPIREMTKLIQATRAYESSLQAINTFNLVDGKSVNEIAKSY